MCFPTPPARYFAVHSIIGSDHAFYILQRFAGAPSRQTMCVPTPSSRAVRPTIPFLLMQDSAVAPSHQTNERFHKSPCGGRWNDPRATSCLSLPLSLALAPFTHLNPTTPCSPQYIERDFFRGGGERLSLRHAHPTPCPPQPSSARANLTRVRLP